MARGAPVTVTVSAADVPGDPLWYEFDFDGNGSFDIANATGVAEHTYALAGTYPVNVRVTDGDGGETAGSTTVRVLPILTFAASGSSVSESAGDVAIEARLSDALPVDLVLPLAVSGTAADLARLRRSPATPGDCGGSTVRQRSFGRGRRPAGRVG